MSLKKIENLYSAYDYINAPIFIISLSNFQIAYANPSGCKLTGFTWKALNTTSFIHLFQSADKIKIQEMLESGLEVGLFRVYGVKLRRKSSRILTVDLAGKLLKADDSDLIIMSVHDVSALRNLADKLKLQVEIQSASLISSSKMKSLGEMAGGIAHEINTPLTIILHASEKLQELAVSKELDAKKVTKSLQIISSTTLRIAKIIKGLLYFAKEGEKAPVQSALINQIIENTLDLCRENFKTHGIDLRVIEQKQGLEIQCREVQISQAILNILMNSFDAIRDSSKPWIEIEILENGATVQINITDSGKGVNEKIQERIFDPFFTTKEIGQGTGLGLSISRGIFEAHHGVIEIDSKSINTRFVIELPKSQPKKII